MTIKTLKGEFVCECDECGIRQYGGAQEDFTEFVNELKGEGWSFHKDDDNWSHTCIDCTAMDWSNDE